MVAMFSEFGLIEFEIRNRIKWILLYWYLKVLMAPEKLVKG
jgi:hypothetical protein